MRNPLNIVSEWVQESIVPSWGALRSTMRLGGTFYPERPYYDKTNLDYNTLRQLYRNDGDDTNLGAGFCKPIIDRAVEFIALPTVASPNDANDNFINDAIHDHWFAELQEMFRNAMRDGKVVVRILKPRIDNPLVTADDRDHLRLKLYNPESVTILRAPDNDEWIEKAIFKHWIEFDDASFPDRNLEFGVGVVPKVKEHEIWEIITPETYTYWDNTDKKWLTTWATTNADKFVPAVECWNEYDVSLSGGQSDLESCYPFVKAFHEVLLQSLKAHKYHSTPKVQFQVKNVINFLRNNWPDVIDPVTMLPAAGATIPWNGTEIVFTDVDEKMGFIEAASVLGDSKTLLEFLIDCIAVSSQTPEWAFMRVDGAAASGGMTSQTIPFEKRIHRKRRMFAKDIQLLTRMALVMNGKSPVTATVIWPTIRLEDLVSKGQAIQQLIMGFDVAASHEWISDPSVVKILASMFTEMKSPEEEMRLAKDNVIPEIPAPAPASDTQAAAPNGSNGNGSGKGKKKQAVRKALATSQPSRS